MRLIKDKGGVGQELQLNSALDSSYSLGMTGTGERICLGIYLMFVFI